MKELTPILADERYQHFIEELQAILTEGVYDANLRLIETYHQFGSRIVEETENFNRAKIYGESITKRIAEDIGKSQRTVQKAVQFALKYPDLEKFLGEVEEGKTISWNKISNKYLVESKQLPEPEPMMNLSVENIQRALLSNVDFLVKAAEITNGGIVFFLPKDRII